MSTPDNISSHSQNLTVCSVPHMPLFSEFCGNRLSSFCVTNKLTPIKHNLLAEVIRVSPALPHFTNTQEIMESKASASATRRAKSRSTNYRFRDFSSPVFSLLGAKVLGTLAPKNESSREGKTPGTFVLQSNNTGEPTVRVTTSYT